ncbi:MAG: hypothetical protein NVS2B12_03590 [Ktedonobacteraceae bacterium]
MPDSVSPIVENSGEGHVLQFSPTERLVWKATAATTGGVMDQFELIAEPNHFGAPEHIHSAVDEFFYILEGAFRFKVDGKQLTAEAGSFLFVPRGTAHTWRNGAKTQSRMLLTYIPGGMEPFFEEASPYMFADPVDMVALEKVNERHDTKIVGPPLPLDS